MNVFTLASGRRIEKDATHCVAVLSRGRWSHRWYRSLKGAKNEIRMLRAMSETTRIYYGLESYRMILPDPT
jgi:hypothetical protein